MKSRWIVPFFLAVVAGCASSHSAKLASSQYVLVNADPGVSWTATVSGSGGESKTIQGTGGTTIRGYDCAAISKNGGPGKLCATSIVGGVGGEEQCTDAPHGSVTVCGRPEPSPANDIYSMDPSLKSTPISKRQATPRESNLRH